MKRFLGILFLFVIAPLWLATGAGATIWINHGGQGDALLGELYMVDYSVGTYTTFFDVANTSETDWVEIHVRLRSGRYSIEVWDKQFKLSPMDKDWFQIEYDEGGYYIFGDKLEKEYLKMDLLDDIGFTKNSEIGELAIGYIEIFGVAAASSEADLHSKTDLRDVDAELMGHVYLGDWTTGEYLGYRMLAFADFRTSELAANHRDLRTGTSAANGPPYSGAVDKDVTVCYPQWKFERTTPGSTTDLTGNIVPTTALCTEPYENSDWATTHGMTWNDGDDENGSGVPGFGITGWNPVSFSVLNEAAGNAVLAKVNLGPSANWSLDDVENALWKSRIKSDYFNIEKGNVYEDVTVTLAAVTFPAKYLHFFYENWNPGVGLWNNAVAKAQRAALLTPPTGVPISLGVWDMDENHWGSSPQQTDDLPWEVNLIPIGDVSQAFFEGWPLLYAPSAGFNVGPLVATYPMGWFFIDFRAITPNWFVRGASMWPGVNLIMNYDTTNYLHARGFGWHYDWLDVPNL